MELNYNLKKMKNRTLEFQLVSTNHLTKGVWFRDDQDYKVGMNYVAIIAAASGITVLAFILMSNHVHFLLQCSKEEAEWFINEYKRRYSEYLNRRYGTDDFLRLNKIDVQPVYMKDESLEKAFAYVLMNCVAANICLSANEYPWSSAGIYFNLNTPRGVRSGDLSKNYRCRLLHSRAEIPDDLLIGEDGYILPYSYIPVKFVESLFKTPKRLNYFLLNSSKAKRVLASEIGLPAFSDNTILSAIPDLCKSLFRQSRVSELSDKDTAELIKQVKYRFSADIHQISRVLGAPYPDIAKLLEEF